MTFKKPHALSVIFGNSNYLEHCESLFNFVQCRNNLILIFTKSYEALLLGQMENQAPGNTTHQVAKEVF